MIYRYPITRELFGRVLHVVERLQVGEEVSEFEALRKECTLSK